MAEEPKKETESKVEDVASLAAADRHRLIGAMIWFLVLLWWVPSWYDHPVNFSPNQADEEADSEVVEPQVIAEKAYRLPEKPSSNQSEKQTEKQSELSSSSVAKVTPPAKVSPVMPSKPQQSKPQKPQPDGHAPQSTGSSEKLFTKSSADTAESPSDALIAEALMVKKGWFVRLAAFQAVETANQLLAKLDEAGYEGYVKPIQQGKFFAVVIGVFPDQQTALAVKRHVDRIFFVDAWVFERK